MLGLVDIEETAFVGDAAQLAATTVSPAVVTADMNAAARHRLGNNQIAAMGADVVEGADLAFLVAGDQHRDAANLDFLDQEAVGLRQLFLPPHDQPGAGEDAVTLDGEKFRRAVGLQRDRAGIEAGALCPGTGFGIHDASSHA